jgi:hypothetical protein
MCNAHRTLFSITNTLSFATFSTKLNKDINKRFFYFKKFSYRGVKNFSTVPYLVYLSASLVI